jgi:hypothetical protein
MPAKLSAEEMALAVAALRLAGDLDDDDDPPAGVSIDF